MSEAFEHSLVYCIGDVLDSGLHVALSTLDVAITEESVISIGEFQCLAVAEVNLDGEFGHAISSKLAAILYDL